MATQKRKKGRGLRRFYYTLVALSAVVVGLFLAWKFLVPPPDVSVPVPSHFPAVSDDPSTPEDESAMHEAQHSRLRRELCYTFLLAASDQSSGNADTIMAARYDVPSGQVGLVSIPRDTLVDRKYQGYSYHKINAAYALGGVEELRGAVEDLLGIPMDFYVTVDIRAFEELVDAVGGVDFYVPVHMSYDDPTQDLHIHYEEGMYYDLTGKQLLEIARCRKNTDGLELGKDSWIYDAYPDADIGRTRTQQQILKAIAKELLSWGSIPRITSYVDIFQRNVTTDLSGSDLLYFATSAMGVDLSSGLSTATFPGDGTVTYKGTSWCYAYDREAALEIINTMLNPYTDDITDQDIHMVSP